MRTARTHPQSVATKLETAQGLPDAVQPADVRDLVLHKEYLLERREVLYRLGHVSQQVEREI